MKRVIYLLFLCTLLVFAGQAYALNIYPGLEDVNGLDVGIQNSQNDINTYLETRFDPDLVELYKAEVPSTEEGSLAGSYETTFLNTATDPSGATISYVGGPYISDAWLLVKDGNHEPWWFLFDLTKEGLDWDGQETLNLYGFWDDPELGGAISHVSLYGNVSVPEPSTVLLLGLGLVGLAGIGRKRMKR